MCSRKREPGVGKPTPLPKLRSGLLKLLPAVATFLPQVPFMMFVDKSTNAADAVVSDDGISRKRGGRPRVMNEMLLCARISPACTFEQRDEVRAAARARGLKVSEFLLVNALGLPLPKALAVNHDALQMFVQLLPIMELLRADSRNLNQLAAHLNLQAQHGSVSPDIDAPQLLQVVQNHATRVRDLDKSMSEIRKLLNPTDQR